MKKIISWIKGFLFPPPGSPGWRRALPYAVLGIISLGIVIGGVFTWNYTGSNEFCGTTCHTMPPQYSTLLVSPHARVNCVDCHVGRAPLPIEIVRKTETSSETFISLITNNYTYPILAHNMRPANESCETCHWPEKFSSDKLDQIQHFIPDLTNSEETLYIIMKTGGGTEREGLGYGIHWHIENPVYFYASDGLKQQDIPYIKMTDNDGTIREYIDIESGFDPSSIQPSDLKKIDCITCHNRTSHQILQPEDAVEQLMARGQISTSIPEIRRTAVEALRNQYVSIDQATRSIATLIDYYRKYYPDFVAQNGKLVDEAISVLQKTYTSSVFPEQGFTWDTHPDNAGHKFSPGCFRCHDGKHLDSEGASIRLECNLCHSIPIQVGASDLVADIEISRGPEPESHYHPNWIALHREIFDNTCVNCHTVEDPGGTSNTSFCSNSTCHGSVWTYAGFDAPALRQELSSQLQELSPTPTQISEPSQPGEPVTYDGVIKQILQNKCGACHGENGENGLNLTAYKKLMEGGTSGPAVSPGDIANSLIIKELTGDQPHFAQLTDDEMKLVKAWILIGAPEK